MSIEAMKTHKCPHCEREFVCNHHEWVGLTYEEIKNIHWSKPMNDYGFARAIEAKLREKNAYGWQSVSNPTEYLDELRGGKDEPRANQDLCGND